MEFGRPRLSLLQEPMKPGERRTFRELVPGANLVCTSELIGRDYEAVELLGRLSAEHDTTVVMVTHDHKAADDVFNILKERSISVDSTTWNRRYREYMEKIKTGSIFEVAEVLRDLYLLKHDKDLSFGERKMLDTAKALLVKELSIARDMAEDEVEAEFTQIFHPN